VLVHGAHHGARTVGFGTSAEDDRVERRHRPREPAPRLLAEARVADDAGGDEGMRRL
jgi:hypothetical protein